MNWKCFFFGHIPSFVECSFDEHMEGYLHPGCLRCGKKESNELWKMTSKGVYERIDK